MKLLTTAGGPFLISSTQFAFEWGGSSSKFKCMADGYDSDYEFIYETSDAINRYVSSVTVGFESLLYIGGDPNDVFIAYNNDKIYLIRWIAAARLPTEDELLDMMNSRNISLVEPILTFQGNGSGSCRYVLFDAAINGNDIEQELNQENSEYCAWLEFPRSTSWLVSSFEFNIFDEDKKAGEFLVHSIASNSTAI